MSTKAAQLAGQVERWIESLTCINGDRQDQPLQLVQWQRDLLRAVCDPSVSTIGASLPKGAGKTTICAALACAYISPTAPLYRRQNEVIICSGSLALTVPFLRQARGFLAQKHGDDPSLTGQQKRGDFRLRHGGSQVDLIEFIPGGCSIRAVSGSPSQLMGLQSALLIADECAGWPASKADDMLGQILASAGKVPGSSIVAISTFSDDESNLFAKRMRADYGDRFQTRLLYQGADSENLDEVLSESNWRGCNPGLGDKPSLENRIRQEAQAAHDDDEALARFKSLRLNLGNPISNIRSLILDRGDWERIEVAHDPALQRGLSCWGIDASLGKSMFALCAFWPDTGYARSMACYPGIPNLTAREKADGVARGTYAELHRRGELVLSEGSRIVNVRKLFGLALERYGKPRLVIGDSFRSDEAEQVLADLRIPARFVKRRTGFVSSSADLESFRKMVLTEQVKHERSLLMVHALGQSVAIQDTTGNLKLASRSDHRSQAPTNARNDPTQAAILAIGHGSALWREQLSRHGLPR